MCANCQHTGVWLFLSVLLLIASVGGSPESVCQGRSGLLPAELTLTTPLVAQIVKETGSEITQAELNGFNTSGQTCQDVYKFIASHAPRQSRGAFDVKPEVWIASSVAVVIISLVGLLGVGIVPLVNKKFYNDVIQFLVALAVGCLTGDAFLHLLPHAIAGEHAHEHGGEETGGGISGEQEAVLKGLVALGGMYFFFLAEKMVSTISDYRTEKKAEEEERKRILNNPRKSVDGIRRLSTFRESISVGSSFRRSSRLGVPEAVRRKSRASSLVFDDILTTGLTAKAMKTVDVLSAYAEESDEDLQPDAEGNLTLQVPVINSPAKVTTSSESDEPTAAHKDGAAEATAEGKDCGHAHGHSHERNLAGLAKLPGSLASVAWMVIMGDGLHNFTDGMAIGVAFAVSMAGGISTTIAVFCHELPHELGDFAVLLKTGMRIKEALFFNIVSSVLCLVGMLVGIGVGNTEEASSWIFALTAGTFVYIALVDMLPELNSFPVKAGKSRILQIFLQNLGLITGAGIMLLIAMYEDQLLHIVG